MDSPNHYADVAASNKACGAYRVPYFGAALPQDVLAMRRRLIDEEYTELQKGLSEGCRVQIADACADLAYVCMGWLWAARWPDKKFINCSAFSPDVFLKMMEKDSHAINTSTDAMWVSIMFDDALNLGFSMGLPMDEVWAEVQRSNMAKKTADGTVKRREDGKILKPGGWKPPDIRGVLERSRCAVIRDVQIERLLKTWDKMMSLNSIETNCIDAEVGNAIQRQDDFRDAIEQIRNEHEAKT